MFGIYKIAYRNTHGKKPHSQVWQSAVFMGKQKVSCQTGHVAGLGTLWSSKSSNTSTKEKKKSQSQGMQSGVSWCQWLERTHQHKHGVEDLCLYESQHVVSGYKALSHRAPLSFCQSPPAQIQSHNCKTEPVALSLVERVGFLWHCSCDKLFKECLMQTLIFSAGSWGFSLCFEKKRRQHWSTGHLGSEFWNELKMS